MSEKPPQKPAMLDNPKYRLIYFGVLFIGFISFLSITVASQNLAPHTTTLTQTTTLPTYTQTQYQEICMNQYLQNGTVTYKIQSCPTIEYVPTSTTILGINQDWIYGAIFGFVGMVLALTLFGRRHF